MSVSGDVLAPDTDSVTTAPDQLSGEAVSQEIYKSPEEHIRALIDGLRREGDSIESSEVRSNALHLLHTWTRKIMQWNTDDPPSADAYELQLPPVKSLDLISLLSYNEIQTEAEYRHAARLARSDRAAENYITLRVAKDDEARELEELSGDVAIGPVILMRESYTQAIANHPEHLEFDVKGRYAIAMAQTDAGIIPEMYYFGETQQPHIHHYSETFHTWTRVDAPEDFVFEPGVAPQVQPIHPGHKADNAQIATALGILSLSTFGPDFNSNRS